MTQPISSPLGAFDEDHPPSRELVDECVHCGFCLATCPTFLLWGEEMDTPRGRIYLMKAALDGAPLNDSLVRHIDNCLGCMSCATACPSGVNYEALITATRGQIERNHDRKFAEKLKRGLVFSLFPYPKRLRVARTFLRLYQQTGLQRLIRRLGILNLAPPFLRTMESIAPPIVKHGPLGEFNPAHGAKRGSVGLLVGCVQGTFFPQVNEATVRVLTAEGFDVIAPREQGCCGALSSHSGRLHEAQAFARRLIDTFEATNVTNIIVNSAGCGSSMKEYSDLLSGDRQYRERAQRFSALTVDIAEFLASVPPVAPRHELNMQVAYHDACHLGHAQRIRNEPRALLTQIPGLVIREIAESEICCGSAGVYNIFHPEPASELGDRKAANVAATQAQVLVAANPGCTMQISSSMSKQEIQMPVAHTIEVIDASIRKVSSEHFLRQLKSHITKVSS